MDVKLARELIKTKTVQELSTYLTSGLSFSLSDVPPAKQTFLLAQQLKPVEHSEEYTIALKVKSYNASCGSLDGVQCDLCGNKGFVMGVDENGSESLTECVCMNRRRSIQRAQRSGMGELLQKNLDNYEITESWQQTLINGARYYIANQHGEWYMMAGQSGAGKTHICSAIVNDYIHKGKSAIYMQWTSAVKELKLQATEDYANILHKYIKTDVLYIDDLFKGKVTDAVLTIAFEIINARAIRSDAITIISTERSLDELNQLDSATAGRIAQRCGRYIVNIKPDPAKNYRFRGVVSI